MIAREDLAVKTRHHGHTKPLDVALMGHHDSERARSVLGAKPACGKRAHLGAEFARLNLAEAARLTLIRVLGSMQAPPATLMTSPAQGR